MNYIFERSAKKQQNEEMRLINDIRNAFFSLAHCDHIIYYVQSKKICFNCLKIVDSNETHKCINNQQKYLIDVLNAIVAHIDSIRICYWCQNTFNENEIINHLMRCRLNIFQSYSSYSRIFPDSLTSFIDRLRAFSMENISLKMDYEFLIYILDEIIFDYHNNFNEKKEDYKATKGI